MKALDEYKYGQLFSILDNLEHVSVALDHIQYSSDDPQLREACNTLKASRLALHSMLIGRLTSER